MNELGSYRAPGPDGSLAGEVALAVAKELARTTLLFGFVGAYGTAGGGEDSNWGDGPGPSESATTHAAVGPEIQALFYFADRKGDLRVGAGARYRNFAMARFRAWAIEIPMDVGVDVTLARNTVWLGGSFRVSLVSKPHDTAGENWNPGRAQPRLTGTKLPATMRSSLAGTALG